ncbi:MAG: hypothetical protein NTV34_09030, partial [Proteobacteria bacterium]|nr:hypothetical protein [Pseudomonadota bacterium]
MQTPDSRTVLSLESTPYHYDFIPEGTLPPECPGPNCPLDPSNNSTLLTKEAKPFANILNATTKEGWHGTMYIRWDLSTPNFVRHPDDKIAFDFYGIAGKSYRFFVDGIPVSAENGGTSQRAIIFSPKKPAGSPLSLGFEVAVGRSLAPGLITVSQPFLSPPDIVENLRQSYRGMDQLSIVPAATAFAIIAILAGFACFFTPFFREILAFSVFVTLSNWRQLLINDLAEFPSFLAVDFVTVAGILKCWIVGSLLAFSGLYFRIRSRLMWAPVIIYAALGIFCLLAGRFGVGLDFLIFLNKANDLNFAFAMFVASCYGFFVWNQTRTKSWAKFRSYASLGIAVLCLP